MARLQKTEHGTKIWLSANDTDNWAHKLGDSWPCSQLSGRRVFAEFDARGDLVDMAIDGSSAVDCAADEFSAITSDFLLDEYGPDHPAIRRAS